MFLAVEKYGGTSVGSVERINAVADRVATARQRGESLVVVVSAMAGETNRLLDLASQIDPDALSREMDVLLSTGEQVTIALLSMALHKRGIEARSYTGGQVRILTDSIHGKARIRDIDAARVRTDLELNRVVVVAGFQGVDDDGNITTLGRGGSDTTAVAMAAALEADECRIFTDVDGVYTADPRIVPEARRLDQITVEEMLELASQGAKVLQTRSVEFAGKYHVPLRVLSSFEDGPGTLITHEVSDMEQPLISGIAYNRDEAKVTIRGVPDQPGAASRIFGPISKAHLNIDMIIQNVSQDGTTDVTFTVNRDEYPEAMALLNKTAKELNARDVVGDDTLAKIAIVGVGMRSHSGVAAMMFEALAAEGINIELISTSEIKISVGVNDKYLELAVRALHKAFGLDGEGTEEQLAEAKDI
ncbi:MAG: aspartate kinase [Acidiferrobacteraceae bacterium]|jgi:aspartate kinase|nr:aspartate kinase [Acidiferrobacteraceae bacterium]MBT3640110.1 aspartate kinase [Acidiferrobacteraceae bacterium]MBT3768712.1 aspartate kinase [Acidiferrobacteraceae bacterium]MBT3973967.1 aspartate kinase [Acidiferrobacteraceae bacterium]MBT4395399.1 aspartate kinase [Acidiferrobacteraceae bacterium]